MHAQLLRVDVGHERVPLGQELHAAPDHERAPAALQPHAAARATEPRLEAGQQRTRVSGHACAGRADPSMSRLSLLSRLRDSTVETLIFTGR